MTTGSAPAGGREGWEVAGAMSISVMTRVVWFVVAAAGGGMAGGVADASTTRWTGLQAPLPLLSVSLWPQVPLRLGSQYPVSSHVTGFCGAAGSAADAGGLGSQVPPLLFSQFFLLHVFHPPPPLDV